MSVNQPPVLDGRLQSFRQDLIDTLSASKVSYVLEYVNYLESNKPPKCESKEGFLKLCKETIEAFMVKVWL